MHISFVNISETVIDSAKITIALNIMSHIDFRLAYLVLTLTYSKSQLGRRNGPREILRRMSASGMPFLVYILNRSIRLGQSCVLWRAYSCRKGTLRYWISPTF